MTSISTAQRDELEDIRDIAAAVITQPLAIPQDLWPEQIALALNAAGYRKPRTITTAEELDALPAGAVILGRDGAACQKEEFPGMWGSAGELFSTDFVALPATVLHEPATEATR